MIAVRRAAAAFACSVLLLVGVVAPPSAPASVTATAPAAPWVITEVVTPVTGAAGTIVSASPQCPAGQEVIGGDVRDMSDFRFVRVKAAMPNWGDGSYLGAAAIDSNNGPQSFAVAAYCLPSALAAATAVRQVFFNPPGGALGQGVAGGGVSCDPGHVMIGGGARLWDYASSGTGFLLSSSPRTDGTGWYATATLNTSSVLVEVLCLPADQVPVRTLRTRTQTNSHDFYAYFVGSPSVVCPDGTQVLAGGGYTAVAGQFPNPDDPNQGHVAQSHSETGYWFATIGLRPGYESTTIVWCVPDTGRPIVALTAPAASPFAARVALPTGIKVAWTGSDAADFVAGYQVRWRSAAYNGSFGAWQTPAAWSDLTGAQLTHGSRPAGATYCYSARGHDPAGNWSAWSAPRCAIRPVDDRSLAVSAGWTRASAGPYWNGTYTTTTQLNAKLTRTGVRFNQLGILATKCPSCGKVRVSVGATTIGTVNLANPTIAHRQVIALPRTPGMVGTVTITVITSGKTVSIDGLVVSAT